MAFFNLIAAIIGGVSAIFLAHFYVVFRPDLPPEKQRKRNLMYGFAIGLNLFAMSVNIWLFVTNPS